MRPRDLLSLLEDSTGKRPRDGENYRLLAELTDGGPRAYIAIAASGAVSVLLPIEGCNVSAKLTGGLMFAASEDVSFRHGRRKWREAAAIAECRDDRLRETFCVFVEALRSQLPRERKPEWSEVAEVFDGWEQLLRHRRLLSSEEELGLWGELWLVAASDEPDLLLDAWRGPEADLIDFFLDGKGFEVKTTRNAGVHFVSHEQVSLATGDLPTYFVSLTVVVDPSGGSSLTDLVNEFSDRVRDRILVERALLMAGFSRADGPGYTKRFRISRPPSVFSRDAIPRVRVADPGVSRLRYRVTLDDDAALTGTSFQRAMETLRLDPRRLDPNKAE